MDDPKLYRASLLSTVLAVSTDGDENELDEQRSTVLRISRISETDAHGRLLMSDFYGESLMSCVLAARNEAGLPFETLALSEPCGVTTRTYIQPQSLTEAAAEHDDAISFHALLSGDVLYIRPHDDDPADMSYLRIMEVGFYGKDHTVLFGGETLVDVIEAVRRNFDVCKVVMKAVEIHPREKVGSPWRLQSF
jgi:hypothetical protein